MDKEEWVRSIENACSNPDEIDTDIYDELEISSGEEDREHTNNKIRERRLQSSVLSPNRLTTMEVATSKEMSNLLPFDQNQNQFSFHFRHVVPKHIPKSEHDNAYDEEEIGFNTSNEHDLEHLTSDDEMPSPSIALRNTPSQYSHSQHNQREEKAASNDNFFGDYYKETSSSYGEEDDALPPPPPEDELHVNFSFNACTPSPTQEDKSSTLPSECPSPFPPKHSTPIKPPPPPPPPSKLMQAKQFILKKNETEVGSHRNGSTPDRKSSRNTDFCGRPINVNSTKGFGGAILPEQSEKRYNVDKNAKENWGSIAAMITNTPRLKSNETRTFR